MVMLAGAAKVAPSDGDAIAANGGTLPVTTRLTGEEVPVAPNASNATARMA